MKDDIIKLPYKERDGKLEEEYWKVIYRTHKNTIEMDCFTSEVDADVFIALLNKKAENDDK